MPCHQEVMITSVFCKYYGCRNGQKVSNPSKFSEYLEFPESNHNQISWITWTWTKAIDFEKALGGWQESVHYFDAVHYKLAFAHKKTVLS